MYRLLIADSDPMNQEAVCGMLDWASYGFDSILNAGSYAEVVDLALDQHPQLVLVNAEIEGGKGYDLIRQLRGAGSSAIFCLLSRRNTRDELHKAMRCGARECLHLPLQEDVLREFAEWVLTRELGGVLPQEPLSPSHQDPVLQREYSEFSRITNKIIMIVKSGYRQPQTLTGIAESMHMTVSEVETVRKLLDNARLVGKAHEVKEPEEETPEDTQAVEDTAYYQARERVDSLMSGISELEQKVVTMRYGLDGKAPQTAQEVGRKLNLTVSEVVELETAALNKMRKSGE